MHTVIADECTGCELCIAPCPVDCIVMLPLENQEISRAEKLAKAQHAKQRYEAQIKRKALEAVKKPNA